MPGTELAPGEWSAGPSGEDRVASTAAAQTPGRSPPAPAPAPTRLQRRVPRPREAAALWAGPAGPGAKAGGGRSGGAGAALRGGEGAGHAVLERHGDRGAGRGGGGAGPPATETNSPRRGRPAPPLTWPPSASSPHSAALPK